MAVTKIIPIRTTIQNSVEYICNPAKTDDRLLVHSENCFPHTAGLEFQHYLRQARAGGNTIGRHLIQSFAPGEVSPEQAHEIGKKLAAEILHGEYGLVMATHVDRGHVHNHFVWCAANVVTHKKYRSNKNTYHEIRGISDRLCKENELSVIVPQGRGKSYDSYKPDQTSGSWKSKLQAAIDGLIPEAKDFEHLLKLMEARGYRIKRGKYISFSAEGQERFTRAKSLGEGYAEEEIKKRILEKPERKPEEISPPTMPPPEVRSETRPTMPPIPKGSNETLPTAPTEKPKTIKPLLDIAGNPKYAESRGLEQWAKLQNLKNSAAAFNLMMEYGGMEAFNKLLNDCRTYVATIENGIKANSERVTGLKYVRDDIKTYHRTRPVYKEYTEIKMKFFKDRFYKKNSGEIIEHENALIALRDCKRPLRKVEDINAEIKRIEAANVNNNKTLAIKKAELNQLGIVHSYLYYLKLEHEPPPPPREQTRTHKRSYGLDR